MKNNNTLIIGIIAIVAILIINPFGITTTIFSTLGFETTNADFVYNYYFIGWDETTTNTPIFVPDLVSGQFSLNPQPTTYDANCDMGTRTQEIVSERYINYGLPTQQLLPAVTRTVNSGVFTAPNPSQSCWKTSTNYGEFIYAEQKEVVKGIWIGLISDATARSYLPDIGRSKDNDYVFGVNAYGGFNSKYYIKVNKSLVTAEIIDTKSNLSLYENYSIKVRVKNDIGIGLRCAIEFIPVYKTYFTGMTQDHIYFSCNQGTSEIDIPINTSKIGRYSLVLPNVDIIFSSGSVDYPVIIKSGINKDFTVSPLPYYFDGQGNKIFGCLENTDCSSNNICYKNKCVIKEDINSSLNETVYLDGEIITPEDITIQEKDYTLWAILIILIVLGGAFLYSKYK